jgi:hypothetical protein
MSSLFLCHSSKDKEFVRQLADDLSVLGVAPWFDEWELGPGDSLHAVIGRAIAESAYLGVVVSPDSVSSPWCQAELNNALAREMQVGRTFVMPIIHRQAELPTFLLDKVYIDFSNAYYPSLARLAGAVLGVNLRLLSRALSHDEGRDLVDARTALAAAGAEGMIDLPDHVVEELRSVLGRHGYVLGREFGILTDLRKRGGGGMAAC